MPNTVEKTTYVDEPTYPRTLIENLGLSRPWLAKELQENKLTYLYASVVYALEDGINSAFSLLNLGFAITAAMHQESDSLSGNEFHTWEVTPEGLAITISFALFLMTFSALGTYYSDEENQKNSWLGVYLACTIAWALPYLRDMWKPIKWGYRGTRSTLSVILKLSGNKEILFHLLFPIAIPIIVLDILARLWIRSMKAERKKMMKLNDELRVDIFNSSNNSSIELNNNLSNWGENNLIEYKKKIINKLDKNRQSDFLVVCCYAITAFSALVDALYFYMGVLFLVSFSPHTFIGMLVISSLLFALCFVARIYEEYDYQRKLHVTRTNVLLDLCELNFHWLSIKLNLTLELLHSSENKHLLDNESLLNDELLNLFYLELIEFEKLQVELRSQTEHTLDLAIFLEGLKGGLSVQGVLMGFMFFTIAMMLISSTPCPVIFVIATISVSFLALIACVVRYLVSYYAVYRVSLDARDELIAKSANWNEEYTSEHDVKKKLQIIIDRKKAITNKVIAPQPEYTMEWCEVLRLLMSGYSKSGKTFNEVTVDPAHFNDHHESVSVFIVSVLFSMVVAVAFALRTVKKMFTTPDAPLHTIDPSLSENSFFLKPVDSTSGEDGNNNPLVSPSDNNA